QEVKKQRGRSRTQFNKREFIFKSLKCGDCGYSITSDRKKDKYNYLKCTEYGGNHNAPRVNEDKLLAQVKEVFGGIQVPEYVLPDVVADLERDHEGEQEHYKRNVARLRREYDEIDQEVKDLFKDRKKFKLRPDLFDEMVTDYSKRQEDIMMQLEDHGKADKLFVITASYILDIASRANELFEAESSKVEQKRYLINFVLSNLQMKGDKLTFDLKEPFDALAAMSKTQNWLRGPDSNRQP
ncbi:MAG TPA: zinc ribbon domain-containing protein, partial [Candidatus Saccharimonadales bacterium]|nr:zinc ribbon domain-containing protein [Candidatus Saccharimonadales bacterium]